MNFEDVEEFEVMIFNMNLINYCHFDSVDFSGVVFFVVSKNDTRCHCILAESAFIFLLLALALLFGYQHCKTGFAWNNSYS